MFFQEVLHQIAFDRPYNWWNSAQRDLQKLVVKLIGFYWLNERTDFKTVQETEQPFKDAAKEAVRILEFYQPYRDLSDVKAVLFPVVELSEQLGNLVRI